MFTPENLLRAVFEVSGYSAIVPLVVTFINYKFFQADLYPVILLVFLALLGEVVCNIHVQFGLSNFYIFRIYTVLEFTTWSLFYILFFKDRFKTVLFLFFLFLFLLVSVYDYSINGYSGIDNISSSTSGLLLTVYSLFLFYFILNKLLVENLLSSPIFWINTAVLVYFSGNLFLFVFSDLLVKRQDGSYGLFWGIIHSFFNISYNILLSVGLWKTKVK